MPMQALGGITVLDLTHYIAGPYCTKVLADYGAEVIKIERPDQGDGARRLGPFPHDTLDVETSGLFLHLNTNKKSITLDLKSEPGKRIFLELVRDADVVVENFHPGVMSGLGLDYATLSRGNPGLIMTSISNFGSWGPYRDYRATDIVECAMSGWMYPVGEPSRAPLREGGPFIQYVAGLYGAIGTLIALQWALVTGQGQRVEVAMLEAAISILVYDTLDYSYTGQKRERRGRHWTQGNQGTLLSTQPCRDGHIVLSGGGKRLGDLFLLVGRPELAEDPRFKSPQAATEHVDAIEAVLEPWLNAHSKEEIFHAAQTVRMAIGMVLSAKEVLDLAQHRSREYFTEIEHPEAGKLTHTGPPFRMADTPWQIRYPAPLLGQQNEEVYSRRLRYSNDELAGLRAAGVI